MRTKKNDITIRELFRKNLEFAEVTPAPSVRSSLLRRVTFREFLRFNPGNFNIFYAGGVFVAGIAAALLLSHEHGNSGAGNGSVTAKIINADTTSVIEQPSDKGISTVAGSIKVINDPPKISGSVIAPESSLKVSTLGVKDVKNTSPQLNHISSSFIGRNIFSSALNESKLQNKYYSQASFIEPLIHSGCAPLKVMFHNKLASYDSCRWTFGDGGTSGKNDPVWIFDVEGEYKIGLKVYYPDGKSAYSSATVLVYPRPKAHFEISPAKAVLPEDEIRFQNYSANAVKYQWSFGDGLNSDLFEPSHKYPKFGNYDVQLTVASEQGCMDSVTVYNAFSGSAYFIEFPNAFLPDLAGPTGGFYSSKSDEGAQVFHPSYSGVTEYQLKIFSKIGIPIFESNDINLGWDGYNKAQLCDPGVYIWKVRGKFRNGEPFVHMGDVTLLKN